MCCGGAAGDGKAAVAEVPFVGEGVVAGVGGDRAQLNALAFVDDGAAGDGGDGGGGVIDAEGLGLADSAAVGVADGEGDGVVAVVREGMCDGLASERGGCRR